MVLLAVHAQEQYKVVQLQAASARCCSEQQHSVLRFARGSDRYLAGRTSNCHCPAHAVTNQHDWWLLLREELAPDSIGILSMKHYAVGQRCEGSINEISLLILVWSHQQVTYSRSCNQVVLQRHSKQSMVFQSFPHHAIDADNAQALEMHTSLGCACVQHRPAWGVCHLKPS